MSETMKEGIKNFIREVNPDVVVEFEEYDLSCNIFDEIVYVGKTYDKRTDGYFNNFIHTIEPKTAKFNPFLISLLHELGHIETWNEEDADNKDVVYNLLQINADKGEQSLETYCNLYFRIPLEFNATLWGIDYALEHQELMKKYEWLHN